MSFKREPASNMKAQRPASPNGRRPNSSNKREPPRLQDTCSRGLATSPVSSLLLLLLIQAILPLELSRQLADGTSNINSVWLSKEDASPGAHQETRHVPVSVSAPTVNATQPSPPPASPNRRSGDWLPATPSSQLQAASSSLQPSIVSSDSSEAPAGNELRRADLQFEESPFGGLYLSAGAGNLSRLQPSRRNDDQPLWASANQTNAQVHFDEQSGAEQVTGSDAGLAAAKSSALNSLLQALAGTSARGDSSLSGEQLIEELAAPSPPRKSTSSQSSLTSDIYLTSSGKDPGSGNFTEPYIYYLNGNGPVAGRWNLSTGSGSSGEQPSESHFAADDRRRLQPASQSRRRLHSAGTQYDLRDREWPDSGPHPTTLSAYAEELSPADTPTPPITTLSYLTGERQRAQPDFGAAPALVFEPTRAPRPQTPQYHYGASILEPSTSSLGMRRTTPIPHVAAPLYPLAELVAPPEYAPRGQSYFQLQDLVPKQRVVGHPVRQQSVPNRGSVNARRDRLFPQRPANRSSAQETGARMLARDRHHKFAFYSPQRPPAPEAGARKSLLTSLSSRFNNWDISNGLENSFYGSTGSSSNKRPISARPLKARRPRPPNWNNFYQADQGFYLAPGYGALQSPYAHLHPATIYQPFQAAYLGAPLAAVQQPTVASAPSQLNRYYAGAGAASAPRRQRRVPLAATNAHYYGASSQTHSSHLSGGRGLGGSEAHNSAFIPVLAVSVSKTSPAPRPGESPVSNSAADDYLDSKLAQNPPRVSAHDELGGGDLASGSVNRDSQQVRRLLDRQTLSEQRRAAAEQAAQHTTTVKSAVFGYVPHDSPANPLLRAVNILPARSASHDFYASNHQLDQESSGPNYYQVEPALEEPPSLALQLQANSFVQNDITHPFLEQNRKSMLDVYPAPQPQYHGIQLLKPHQATYPQSLGAIGLLNPLLSGAENGLKNPQLLAAAASEIEPLLPALMYATSGRLQAPHLEQQAAASQPEVQHEQQVAAGDLEGDGSGSQVNDKGKKRSSEFFASAGQLLLSALPLLLAPTLGLMFASSPAHARYHGPAPFSGSSSLSAVSAALPSNYINNGLVSNASPTPHLFTPTPPGYLLTSTVSSPRPNRTSGGSSPNRKAASNATAAHKNRTTSSPQVTVTVTTLNPSPVGPAGESSVNKSEGANNSSVSKVGGHTIVLVTTEDDDENSTATVLEPKKSHYAIGYEGADFDAQFPSLQKVNTNDNNNNNDTSISGKPSSEEGAADNVSSNHLDDNVLNLQRHNPGKHRYQYSEVLDKRSGQASANSSAQNNRTSGHEAELGSSSSRLYPVSTWPSSRRRTVSLVTSNGNKTLPDSSYKYPDLDAALSGRSKARSSKRNYTLSSVERPEGANSSKADEVGFVLSDGAGNFFDLVTNGSGESHSSRRKREVSSKEAAAAVASKTRRRKVVKVKVKAGSGKVPVAKPGAVIGSLESVRSINASDQSPTERYREQLDGDSSKSKSAHIITTMITHLDDDRKSDSDSDEAQDGGPAESGAEASANELREQLLKKKIILDRISSTARHRMYERPALEDEEASLEGGGRGGRHRIGVNLSEDFSDESSFSAGGRGRFPSSGGGKSGTRRPASDGLVLIEDSLKVPAPEESEDQLQQHYNKRRRKDVRDRTRRPEESRWKSSEDRYGAFEASSTERSVTTADEAGPFRPLRSNHSSGNEWRQQDLYPRPNPRQPPYQQQVSSASGDRPHNSSWVGEDYLHEPQVHSAGHQLPKSGPPEPNYPLRPVRERASLLEHELAPPSDDRNSADYHNWPAQYGADRYNANPKPNASGSYNLDPTSSLYGYNLYTVNHINSSMNRPHPGDKQEPLPLHPPRFPPYNHSTGSQERLPEPAYEQPSYSNGHYGPSRQQSQQLQQQQPYTYETRYPTAANHYASSSGDSHLPAGSQYTTYAPSAYPPSSSHNTYPPPPMYHTSNHKSANSGSHPSLYAHQSQQQQQQRPQQMNYNQHHGLPDDYAPNYGLKVTPEHQLAPPAEPYDHQQPLPAHKYYNQASETARFSGPAQPADAAAYLGGQPSPPAAPPAIDYHTKYTRHQHYQAPSEAVGGPQYSSNPLGPLGPLLPHLTSSSALANGAMEKAGDSRAVSDYLKRAQFNDSDRDKLMASYLTCDGLLNDNDHCLERLSCEFSDPQNLEKANKLDRAVSSILLGHILINTYIPDQFKLRLKSASLFGYTQSGKCSRFVCHKLSRASGRAA